MSATPTAPQPGTVETPPPASADAPVGAAPLTQFETAPSFRIAFRGYDVREVDRWAKVVETQLEAAVAAHRDLAADVRRLADQLDRAHEELAVLRRRPSVDDTIAFRHLGPRVEQILADAHAEADEVVASARASAEELRGSTEEQLRTTKEQHARAVAEFEAHRRWLQEEELRWTRLLHSRKEAVARADEYRRRVRRDAEELLESATAQHERVVASALVRAEHMLSQASGQAAAIREAAHQTVLGEQEAAVADRNAVQVERDEVRAEWDAVRAEWDAVQRERDDVRAEWDAVQRERDEVRAEWDAVQRERAAAGERDQAPREQEHDLARREQEHDLAQREQEAAPDEGGAEVDAAEHAVGVAPAPSDGAGRARGVAKVVYVVKPGDAEAQPAEHEPAEEEPAEAR